MMEMEGRQISDAYCHDLERLRNDLAHGAPEDFYDFLIWDRLTEQALKHPN